MTVENPTAVEHYGPAAGRLPFERGTDGPRTVLVGIDGGRAADRAVAYAAGMARRQRSQLVVVFVVSPSGLVGLYPMMAGPAMLAANELTDNLRAQVRQLAEELCLPTTFLIRHGRPYAELRDAAQALRADIIVIGACRRAGRPLVGSLAARLVRLGRWPVVVVP